MRNPVDLVDYGQARRSFRLARRLGPAATLYHVSGFDARPGSRPRFRRFIFTVRVLLLPITLLLFAVPQPTYRLNDTRIATAVLLAGWLAVLGAVFERNWSGWRASVLHTVDLVVVFTLFGVSLASNDRNAGGHGYSAVLLHGSFHPQTYGPFLTIGAMLGATRAMAYGLVGGVFYVGALLAAGIHISTLVDHQQLPSLLFAVAGYLAVGGIVGLYSTLLDKLRASRDRGRQLGRAAGRRQIEMEVHDKVLTPVRAVQRFLERVSSKLQAPEDRLRIASAAQYLDTVLVRERANRGATSEVVQCLAEVVTSAFWNQRMFDEDQRMNELQFRPAVLGAEQDQTPLLGYAEAGDVEEIVFEAIENAMKHSAGTVTVVIERRHVRRHVDFHVHVEDQGGGGIESDYKGMGLNNIRRRASSRRWKSELTPLNSGGMRFTLTLPDQNRRQPNWSLPTTGLTFSTDRVRATLWRVPGVRRLSKRWI